MRHKLLVNDVHLGAQRVAGTTLQTQLLIREYLLNSLRELMFKHLDKDIVVNGDLLDAFMTALLDAFGAHCVLRDWLLATEQDPNDLNLEHATRIFFGMGNHDWSKDSAKLSTFHFITQLLRAEFGDRVVVVDKPQLIDEGIYMIPHCPNQELFDLALTKVPEAPKDTHGLLLLHANYDNGYTVESDHSLNVSREQAEALNERGWALVFGHEHQGRRLLEGGVIVTGNQWPSSVADCLNNLEDQKAAHIITDQREIVPVVTWKAEDDLAEVDWQELDTLPAGPRFVRAIGSAVSSEAALVVDTLARFRKESTAWVVTNAVKIEGLNDVDEVQANAETIKSFDVWSYLIEQLTPEQRRLIEDLRKKDQRQLEAA